MFLKSNAGLFGKFDLMFSLISFNILLTRSVNLSISSLKIRDPFLAAITGLSESLYFTISKGFNFLPFKIPERNSKCI